MNDIKKMIKHTWSNMSKKKQIIAGVIVLAIIVIIIT